MKLDREWAEAIARARAAHPELHCLDGVTDSHRVFLEDRRMHGIARGHTTGAPDANWNYAVCFAPAVPVATAGDLRAGYTCR